MKIIVLISGILTIFQLLNAFAKGRAKDVLCSSFTLLTLAAIGRYYL